MTLQLYVSLCSSVLGNEMAVPVGSSSAPAESDYEVTRIVPVGSVSSCALVVLEVGQVAIVVLDIVDGLTLFKLVKLLLRFSGNRRGRGQAEKAEESGRDLHVMSRIDECDCMLCVVVIASSSGTSLAPIYT